VQCLTLGMEETYCCAVATNNQRHAKTQVGRQSIRRRIRVDDCSHKDHAEQSNRDDDLHEGKHALSAWSPQNPTDTARYAVALRSSKCQGVRV